MRRFDAVMAIFGSPPDPQFNIPVLHGTQSVALRYTKCADSDKDLAEVNLLASMPEIRCKTCDTGLLQMAEPYRFSSVVVVIGYILLVPSVLGILFSVRGFFTVLEVGVTGGDSALADGVFALAGGVFIFLGLACLVGGLLGWLLIMRKKVLQCTYCGAVVAAS